MAGHCKTCGTPRDYTEEGSHGTTIRLTEETYFKNRCADSVKLVHQFFSAQFNYFNINSKLSSNLIELNLVVLDTTDYKHYIYKTTEFYSIYIAQGKEPHISTIVGVIYKTMSNNIVALKTFIQVHDKNNAVILPSLTDGIRTTPIILNNNHKYNC